MATTLAPAAANAAYDLPQDRDPALDLDPARVTLSASRLLEIFPQLSKMLSRDIRPEEALANIAEDAGDLPMRAVCLGLAERVQSGMPLETAMLDFPQVFGEDVVGMVATGSTTGRVTDALRDVTKMLRERVELISELKSSAIHPAVTLILCVVIVIGMLYGVVPKMSPMLKMVPPDKLPRTTLWLMHASDVLVAYPGSFAAGAAIGLAALVAWGRTYEGQQQLIRISMYVPVVRKMADNIVMVTFLRATARLLRAGKGAPDALESAAEGVAVEDLRVRYAALGPWVRDGKQVTDAFRDSGLFPGRVRGYVRAGEKSGDLASGVEDAADDTAEAGAKLRKTINGLMPTIMILCVGALVVPVVLALFGGMFALSRGIRP